MRSRTQFPLPFLLATTLAASWLASPRFAGGADSAAAPGPTAATASAPATVTVTVTNPLAVARTSETITLARGEIAKIAPTYDLKKAEVVDAAGHPVLSQLVDLDGDGEPDELVFQTDFAARQSKSFQLRSGKRGLAARADYKVYGRFVRERHDDFAWENDLVAHRVYGPGLETWAKEPLVSSGIDTWVKRVPRLIVNDWYMTDDYHHDSGEGADLYSVGKSRGCGGVGIWAGGKLVPSRNFTNSRVLASGPIRLVFELSYAPWEVAKGVRVSETKRVTLDAGTSFNRIESTFAGARKAPLVAGIGIANHAGSVVEVDAASASMRTYEPLKGPSGEEAGNLGCAIVLPAGSPIEPHHGALDYLVVTPVPAGGKLVYQAGTAWSQAGRVRDAAAWSSEVQGLAARLAAPITIALSPLRTQAWLRRRWAREDRLETDADTCHALPFYKTSTKTPSKTSSKTSSGQTPSGKHLRPRTLTGPDGRGDGKTMSASAPQRPPLDASRLIFAGTTAHRGRAISVTPANSPLEHLAYGRILLGPDVPKAAFSTGERETSLLVMSGACAVTVDGARHELGLHDAVYVPRGKTVEVSTADTVDIVECSSQVNGDYPLQIVRYADVVANPKLRFRAGGTSTSRDVNIVIGDNVKAGRLMIGFTRSQPGHWTSWPPHEHTALAEELYVYFDMPAPAFGIQLVYTRPDAPEFVGIVRDGDAVLMPAGFHPNVAAPGHSINFIWMMAAHRETVDRQFGVVNVQPGFDQGGSGLEASRK